MLNPLNFISKFIKSSNQKELDRIAKIVEKVNLLEDTFKEISNEEFNDAEKALKNFNTLGLILSRPVPGFAELIALSAGLSKMPFKNFIFVVGITNLGVAIVFSGIGAAAIDSNSSFLAFTGAAVLPALCYFFYNKFYKT